MQLPQNSSTIVPLAKLGREHGFVKNGVICFKAELFSRGGTLFRERKSVYVAKNDLEAQAGRWNKIILAEDPAPMGAKFGQATGLLLRFVLSPLVHSGCIVGIERSEFPVLESGFYVSDLMGLKVLNAADEEIGCIAGFVDVAETLGGAVNLRVVRPNKMYFEFPSNWIERLELGAQGFVKVPDIEQWILDPNSPSDEDSQ